MIVSHSQKFIFVATPKTASQSTRVFLRNFINENDWEQCGYYEQKRLPIPHLSLLKTGHLTLAQLKPFLKESQWQRYLKFLVVRDPLDRFLSASFFLNHKLQGNQDTNSELLKMLTNEKWLSRLHFRPQIEFAFHGDELLADYIIRYENLHEGLAHVSGLLSNKSINEPLNVLPELNIGQFRDRTFKPSEAVCRKVHSVYAQDYEAFGYCKHEN